ncbi:MAG: energy-coupling factor transporter transmembrane protein EcfT [Deltaproteobacteria bacterium]|jgi:energy-coupling factor transport system permease protein|nr:energy-coupling factor transporter transmembrane protein EcfT [Deltaproteobacteria bacterium]
MTGFLVGNNCFKKGLTPQGFYEKAKFSAKTKILVLLLVIASANLGAFFPQGVILSFGALFYLLAVGEKGLFAAYGSLLLALWSLFFLFRNLSALGLEFGLFHLFLALKLAPVVMVSHVLIRSEPSELSAILDSLGVSRKVSMSVTVALRYSPTLIKNCKMIFENLSQRGLLTPKTLFLSPLLSLERIIVPLLLRSVKVADDLSMAAVTRGVERPGERESIFARSLSRADYLILLFFLFLLVWSWQSRR